MSYHILFSFMSFAAISSITPGPNNMILLTHGVNFGVKKSLPAMFGVVFGFIIVNLVMGFFLYTLILSNKVLFLIIQIASILYMIYLAYLIIKSSNVSSDEKKEKAAMGFIKMSLLQWLNPKGIGMSAIAMSLYINLYAKNPSISIILLTIIYAIFGLIASYVWVVLGANIRKLFKNPLYLKIFNYAMAILLLISIAPSIYDIVAKL